MKKILTIFLVLLLVGCNQVETTQQEVTEEPVTVVTEEDYRDIYDKEIKELAEEIVNFKPYERDVYDCSDMSNKLVIGLRGLGYKAEYVEGRKLTTETCEGVAYCDKDKDIECINNRCYALHAWVRLITKDQILNIESTNGKVIFNEFFKENYLG